MQTFGVDGGQSDNSVSALLNYIRGIEKPTFLFIDGCVPPCTLACACMCVCVPCATVVSLRVCVCLCALCVCVRPRCALRVFLRARAHVFVCPLCVCVTRL